VPVNFISAQFILFLTWFAPSRLQGTLVAPPPQTQQQKMKFFFSLKPYVMNQYIAISLHYIDLHYNIIILLLY